MVLVDGTPFLRPLRPEQSASSDDDGAVDFDRLRTCLRQHGHAARAGVTTGNKPGSDVDVGWLRCRPCSWETFSGSCSSRC